MDQFFGWLMVFPGALLLLGLLTLLELVPASAKKYKDSPAKTEFHGASAGAWCIVVGLALVAAIVIGAIIQHVAIELSKEAKHVSWRGSYKASQSRSV